MTDNIEIRWQNLIGQLEEKFGSDMDISAMVFLIGVQELGMGFRKFSKDEKVDIMHIATCKLLEKYGHYEFIGKDEEGWPHWNRLKKLPPLNDKEQTVLMKEAILEYFEER